MTTRLPVPVQHYKHDTNYFCTANSAVVTSSYNKGTETLTENIFLAVT